MIPSFDLGERECGVPRRHRNVRRGDEPGSTAERVALHARDNRRGAVVDRLEHLPHRVRVGDVLVDGEADRGAHPVDVGAGAERRTLAREDDRPRLADVDERLPELADQLGVERVAPFRPRERDPQHRSLALDPNGRHRAKLRVRRDAPRNHRRCPDAARGRRRGPGRGRLRAVPRVARLTRGRRRPRVRHDGGGRALRRRGAQAHRRAHVREPAARCRSPSTAARRTLPTPSSLRSTPLQAARMRLP